MRNESLDASDHQTLQLRENGFPSFKSIVDFIATCVLMILAGPIIALLAMLVKATSRGPAFYSQTRLGLGGRPFQIWKLRTMVQNSEAVTGPVWSCRNDQRVTPIGRILRDTHLDELPQLWNVLRGEMSLVGPRPERPEIARRIQADMPGFGLRLLVKPGITGLAQLHVPPDIDISTLPHKLAHDIFYMKHQGLLLDLRILISTAFNFVGTGCVCVSKMLLRSDASVLQEITPAEMATPPEQYLKSNSISIVEPELPAFAGLSAAA